MSDVGSVHSALTNSLNGARPEQIRADSPRSARDSGTSAADRRDQVDLSEFARLKSRLRELPPVRNELVDRIRSEIEAGEYETAEKIEQAVEAIVRDLGR